MTTYARMVGGLAVEIIEPFFVDGQEVPIEKRFHPDVVATLVEWPDGQPLSQPDPEPAPLPMSVTMRQMRLALLAARWLDDVDAALSNLPSPQGRAAQIEWEYAPTVERASSLGALLGATLKLDEAALDALFVQAVQL